MPSTERSLRAEAVVLRHSDWGEADRMLVLYTRERGKLRAVAKGVRKLRSRKAGHLEPFTRVALLLARGRDFWIVTQAETVAAYLPLRDDLMRTAYAAYVVELLDRFTYEEGENQALYRLLMDTLSHISTEEEYQSAVRYYEVRLLDLLGFRPELFLCVNCGNEIQAQDQYLSPERGGALCPNCGPSFEARPISMNALKYLRHFQRSSPADARRVKIPANILKEIEAVMQYHLTYLLERGLNTPSFLRQVRPRVQENRAEDAGE
jgi:DNA repair protein RecO (recombination protein O)